MLGSDDASSSQCLSKAAGTREFSVLERNATPCIRDSVTSRCRNVDSPGDKVVELICELCHRLDGYRSHRETTPPRDRVEDYRAAEQ